MLDKNDLKELMERVHINIRLSSTEEKQLSSMGLKIENDWHDIKLMRKDEILASIPYFTIWYPWKNEWDKFDDDLRINNYLAVK